jgi:translation initiation factor IF-2
MSDHDAAPDPMDKAYIEAEAVLSDEAARAARRARVLAAMAGEPAVASPPASRPAWARGRWLAAAGVAGLAVFLAFQVYTPVSIRPQTAPPAPPASAAAPIPIPIRGADGIAAPPPPAKVPTATSRPASRMPVVTPPPARSPTAAVAPAPAPAPRQNAQPAAAPAPPISSLSEIQEIVVTGQRRTKGDSESAARVGREPTLQSGAAVSPSGAAPPDQAAGLRAAAAAGRPADVAALLAKGVLVDVPDADGNTALMMAVRADHPSVAAALRRRGASLDLRNHAGESARDMARLIGDAKLDQALGLDP